MEYSKDVRSRHSADRAGERGAYRLDYGTGTKIPTTVPGMVPSTSSPRMRKTRSATSLKRMIAQPSSRALWTHNIKANILDTSVRKSLTKFLDQNPLSLSPNILSK